MDLGFDKAKIEQYKAAAIRLMGDPVKIRMVVIGLALALGIGAVYMPLSDSINQAKADLGAQRTRLNTLKETDSLRRQAQTYRSRISPSSDTNEWVQYLLAGSREAQVRLRDMETKSPERVGPYKTVSLAIEIEGPYPNLKRFVEWLESSDRLLRIETLRFEKLPDTLVLKVYLLGLVKKT